jgi:putative endonuclease
MTRIARFHALGVKKAESKPFPNATLVAARENRNRLSRCMHKSRHFVYIIRCSDGTYYTGYTTDVFKRVEVHNRGKGAKYTRCRLPVRLLWFDEYPTKIEAMKKEYALKQLSRKMKEALMRGAVQRIADGGRNNEL